MSQSPVQIVHFSDVLCVWAYVGQVRLDELKHQFGADVSLQHAFLPLFGCTATRIGEGWSTRGGFSGFNKHVLEVAERFPHVEVHPRLWLDVQPRSSAATHLFLKAVQLLENQQLIGTGSEPENTGKTVFEEFVWRVRLAFFRDNRDISQRAVLEDIARDSGLPMLHIQNVLDNGEAIAALCRDAELKERYKVEGSPTFYLNEGRQKLYGNVGYKILEANVREVMSRPCKDMASWC